jgi:hypothetical protein
MRLSPANQKIGAAVRQLITERYNAQEERVFYLDRNGEVISDLRVRNNTRAALRREYEQRLASGELGAVVHTAMSRTGMSGRFSMIEVFDDPAHPTVHALLSWDRGNTFDHRWSAVPTEAADRWLRTWQNTEEEGLPGET